jgi:putative transposase
MDFMIDQLARGKSLRTFNVIDDCNREGFVIDVDLSLLTVRASRALDRSMSGEESLPSYDVAMARSELTRLDGIGAEKRSIGLYPALKVGSERLY